MQKTIKILFDVNDSRYREKFYRLSEHKRELQIPTSLKPTISEFINDWVTVYEKYDIPASVIVVKYIGDRFFLG